MRWVSVSDHPLTDLMMRNRPPLRMPTAIATDRIVVRPPYRLVREGRRAWVEGPGDPDALKQKAGAVVEGMEA